MDRVTALRTIANDTARPAADRNIALKSLRDIANSSPNEQERQSARRVLPDQSQQDADLERALNSKSFADRRSYSDYMDQLSTETQQLWGDMIDPVMLAIPPSEGGIERLKDLCARSQSALVKARALDAVETTERLLARGLKMRPRPVRKAEAVNVTA